MAHWLPRILGSLSLLAIAIVSGVVGWAEAIAPSNPELVLKVIPGQANALLALAEKKRAGKAEPQKVTELGAALMRRSPLLDAPLVYAGMDFTAKGKVAAARTAYTLAAKRQPRNILALSWLAADALHENEIDAAVGYLERLATLNPDGEQLYSEAFASIASNPRGEQLLVARLANGTSLAEKALERLNASSSNMPLLLRLNAGLPKKQGQLVDRLLVEKGPTPAFIAWLSFAPPAEIKSMSWPFDPAFVGSAAAPPFNWRISKGAELLEQGGLYVSYSGRDSPVFAEQITMLSSGSYAFEVEMDGEADASGGSLEWNLQCYPGGQNLGSLAILKLTPILDTQTFRFEVPRSPDCVAQRLILRGQPGEFPARTRATVRRVTFQYAGVVG